MNREFWSSKRVFLTGHTGFKGAWLSIWLKELGAEVCGYALQSPTSPSLFELAQVARGMDSVLGDVRNGTELSHALHQAQPQIVIHMAAQSLVRESYQSPVETYATNVMGTVHLLEAARSCPGVRVVLVVTSDKCYENKEWVWGYRENEAMGGYDPYSNSKGCAELVTAAYRSSYFNPKTYEEHGVAIASARAGNVIGGGDWAKDRLLPDIIAGFEQGREVLIRNPDAIRPWQHVLEPLGGYLTLAQLLYERGASFVGGWNFGPRDDDARTVRWIAEYVANRWGGGVQWSIENVPQPHEAHYLKLDISKAKAGLGWSPRMELSLALDWVVEWSKRRQSGADMRAICVNQIRSYQSMQEN